MTTGGFDTLRDALREWDSRHRQQESVRRLPMGLAAGLLVGLGAALLSRSRPLMTRGELVWLALAAVLIAISLVGLVSLLQRRTLYEQARFGDRRFGLRERLTTAVEIQTGELTVDEAVATRQLSDALEAAAGVDTTRDLPLQWRADDWLPPLALAVVTLLVLWLPNPQEAILLEQRAVAQIVEQQAGALIEMVDEIATDPALTQEQREALLQPLEEALAALTEPEMTREEAVAALSQAETELRRLSHEQDTATLNEALSEAAASLDDSGAAGDLSTAFNNGQLGESAAAAGALADSLDELDAEAQSALAEQLSEAATALADADAEMADSLSRAADALADGDIESAQSALAETAATLNERQQSAATAAQAASAADQLGAARGEVAQQGAGEPGDAGGETTSDAGQGGAGSGTTADGGSQSENTGAPSEGGGHVDNVFVPQRPELQGQGENLELEVQCLSAPESCGPIGGQAPSNSQGQGSVVPYEQVLGDYRNAAFEALAGGNIPLGLQDIIRDYFSALEP
jgi:hypothetical protein